MNRKREERLKERNLQQADKIRATYQRLKTTPKTELLGEAQRAQRVNDFSEKTSKTVLIGAIMEAHFNEFWGVAL